MLSTVFSGYGFFDIIATVLDIAIVSYVLYKLLCLIRGTRAVQLIKGILILLLVALISNIMHFDTIQWILSQLWSVFFVLLVVIFQPELRKALEQIGMSRLFTKSLFSDDGLVDVDRFCTEIIRACVSGSKTKTGMLIVLERTIGLNDYIESGIELDAKVSEQMLVNMFVPNTPLHDGAAIIRGHRIVAAACFLPLTDNPYISTSLGTRHRAAIGLSEVSDALVLVVSEETGIISAAMDGKLVRSLDDKGLRKLLKENLYSGSSDVVPHFWQRRKKDVKK